MRERAEPILKITCLILAALLVYLLAGILIRWNPFRGVTVPALPSLAASTNGPAGGLRATNQLAMMVRATNASALPPASNIVSSATNAGTNLNSQKLPSEKVTNSMAQMEMSPIKAGTESNVAPNLETKMKETNSAFSTTAVANGTNLVVAAAAVGTNAARHPKLEEPGAQSNSLPEMARVNLNPSLPSGNRGNDLPPTLQAQISRITESEILGAVNHPLPMGLTGIAGDVAFLRTDSGQTGLVKEGDTLGDLKLLRIGINQVLVEQNGQKKELTIFSGYGGDSLLPAQKDTTDENKHP